MTLHDLIQTYGHDWTIRSWPQPGATRRQQIGQIDPHGHAYTPPGLTMNIWADTLDDLSEQLAEQKQLLDQAHERGGAGEATPSPARAGEGPRTTTGGQP